MSQIVPRSRVLRVDLSIVVPVDATQEQIDEWVQFELGFSGSLSDDNPLSGHDLEAAAPVMLMDTYRHLHERVAYGDKPNSFKTRRWLAAEPYTGPTVGEQIRELRELAK